jgi:hypothetical protein
VAYALRENLSFCRTDGRLIFLDTQADRYFCLPPTAEQSFIAHMEQGADGGVDDLVERNILVATSSAADRVAATKLAPPSRSPVEQTSQDACNPVEVAQVFAMICWTQWQLRSWPLQRILDGLIAYRRKKQPASQPALDEDNERSLVSAANVFRRARLYTPIETCCLLDSLAMMRFLARRRLYARLVFGVTGDPFAPHCWVQAGDIVLNDTVGHANAHTPIRVI